ncbi:MAG TPA: hypothetical protein VGE37_01490 [Archangium sp.]
MSDDEIKSSLAVIIDAFEEAGDWWRADVARALAAGRVVEVTMQPSRGETREMLLKVQLDLRDFATLTPEQIARRASMTSYLPKTNETATEEARLRALIKQAEWSDNFRDMQSCPWCEEERPPSPEELKRSQANGWKPTGRFGHADTCPAFTPDGQVR